jgi:hypothetical protein
MLSRAIRLFFPYLQEKRKISADVADLRTTFVGEAINIDLEFTGRLFVHKSLLIALTFVVDVQTGFVVMDFEIRTPLIMSNSLD